MIDLRKRNAPHCIAVWLAMLERELGPSAFGDYQFLSDAVQMVLPLDYLRVVEGIHWTLAEQDQEEFCLGFSEESLKSKPAVVKDLDPESRAAQAGVKEGDLITPRYSFFSSAERWGQEFCMAVIRSDGSNDMRVLSWSPRSWHKVLSFQFVQE